MKISILVGLAFLLVGTLALAQDPPPDFADQLQVYEDGGGVRSIRDIRIDSATYEEVRYTQKGNRAATVPGGKVVQVIYGDAPRVYIDGQTNLLRGQYRQAETDFQGAKTAVELGKARPWLNEYAALRRGQALLPLARQEPGLVATAVSEFRTAKAANEKSLLFSEMQLGLVEAHLLERRFDEARAEAESLLSVGQAINHPMWPSRAQQALARVLMAQGRYGDAVNAWQGLVDTAKRSARYTENPRRKELLRELEIAGAVEQAWATVQWAEESGNRSRWDEARSQFEALSGVGETEKERDRVAAARLNGVGRVLMETDPRAGLMKFVEAEVTRFSARSEVARALWLKAQALKKLGGARNLTLAEKALEELREFYPDSEWAGR